MSSKAKRWLKLLDMHLRAMPPGIEAHVGYSSVTIYREGRMEDYMGSEMDGFGINDDSAIASIHTDRRLIPYSKGSQ